MSGEKPNWPERYTNDLKAIVDVESYSGRSERIKGFQRLREAIGNIAGVKYVQPIILLEEANKEYKENGLSDKFKSIVQTVWDRLDGDHYPLIVRRVFPDKDGKDQDGPRSGKLTSRDNLLSEVVNFYRFFDENYLGKDVLPEIMVHRIVDASEPPKYDSPRLPFPGGVVVHLGQNRFQVEATFGADESVRNFPTDQWIVEFKPNGSFTVEPKLLAKKDKSRIAGFSANQYRCVEGQADQSFRTIFLPEKFHEVWSLNGLQVVSLAEVCHRLTELYGPYRLEFDGTRVGDDEQLFIIEAAFDPPMETPDWFRAEFSSGAIKPVRVFDEALIEKNSENEIVVVYIPPIYLGRDQEEQDLLNQFAAVTKAKGTKLVVLAGTNASSHHAVYMFQSSGHAADTVGKVEEFQDGEEVWIFSRENRISWERNPIVLHTNIQGKTVEEIGGKALGLQKLERHGLQTSPYFVIETSLFRRIIEELGLDSMISSLDSLDITDVETIKVMTDSLMKKIREYQGDILKSLEDNLDRAFSQIGGERFFVRSSATCEDGAYPFPGVFATIGNIGKENIPKAILDVIISTFRRGAVSQIRTHRIKLSETGMAVVIQRAVNSQKAGTMFTADKETKDMNTMKIEAAEGFGENVVGGVAAIIDIISIEKRTGEIKNYVFTKDTILEPDEVRKLVELGTEVERSFNEGPQDIEWAIDETGEIFLLQARPVIF